jgi:hypothetical protein
MFLKRRLYTVIRLHPSRKHYALRPRRPLPPFVDVIRQRDVITVRNRWVFLDAAIIGRNAVYQEEDEGIWDGEGQL